MPLLSDQYGEELERGSLELRFDAEQGSFAVWAYGTHKLPICPLHYQRILGNAPPALEQLGDAFAGLPEWRPQVARRASELKERLAALVAEDAEAAEQIRIALARFNGKVGELESWKGLDALIAEQHWRASYFRVAADDINFRRFFNINDLAGLRMELPVRSTALARPISHYHERPPVAAVAAVTVAKTAPDMPQPPVMAETDAHSSALAVPLPIVPAALVASTAPPTPDTAAADPLPA